MGKFLLLESTIQESFSRGIRNAELWNPEFSPRNAESPQRMESRIQVPLTRNIYGNSPRYGIDLPLSHTGHQIARIKETFELFCALVWNLAHFPLKIWTFLLIVRFLVLFFARILIACTSCKTSYNILSHGGCVNLWAVGGRCYGCWHLARWM